MATQEFYMTGVPPKEGERRRFQRIRLQIPMFIRAREAHGKRFVELGKTLDISANGSLLTSPKALNMGEVITLTIPAPSLTSSALIPAGMPPIQAKVVRQQKAGDVYLVSVEFLTPIS